MRSTADTTLRVIHAVGACAALTCLTTFVWLLTFHRDGSGAQIQQLTRRIRAARRDIGALRAAQEQQRALLADREAALAETGRLPAQAPVEEYFRSLSRIAEAHGLQVIRQQPLADRRYPGLLEQRYVYEVTGSTPDLIRFLKSIEDSDFWADVSYLTMDRGSGRETEAVHRRSAVLTLSLFSAPPAQVEPDRKPS